MRLICGASHSAESRAITLKSSAIAYANPQDDNILNFPIAFMNIIA